MKRVVGIFGGSFNPPHIGHQVLCLMVLETCPIDELWIVPTYRHVFGKELAAYDDRVAMCELMSQPLGPRVQVSRVEEEIGGESSRMLDTLTQLAAENPDAEFRLIVGADILLETDHWHRWSDVVALAPPIVFGRKGYPEGDLVAPPEVSSTEVRRRLAAAESVNGLVPTAVLDYIATRGLYR